MMEEQDNSYTQRGIRYLLPTNEEGNTCYIQAKPTSIHTEEGYTERDTRIHTEKEHRYKHAY
jgi:hypothetical protein